MINQPSSPFYLPPPPPLNPNFQLSQTLSMTTAVSPPEQLSLTPQTTRVSPKTVKDATEGLLKWRAVKSKTQKPQLLEQDEFVYLIITLKKIPQTSRTKPYRIPIPHPLINTEEDSPEICLIVDDRAKSGLTKDDAKKKIKSENIPVTKVIKLSKLKSDYRAFESKRKLCDSYDVFFADKRVIPLLPRLIGKKFFVTKKLPISVDLKHKNWKEQIEKACGSAMFFIRTGTCSVVKVGKLNMESDDIVENIMETLNGVVEVLPGKWKYVRSLHLKLTESVALPIYQSVPDLKLRIDGGVEVESEVSEVVEGVGEESGGEEAVAGVVKGKKMKGRIHEVRYMDSDVTEELGEDEIGGGDDDVVVQDEIVVSPENKKKRKKKDAESEKPAKKVAKGKVKEKKTETVVETEKPVKKVAKGKVTEKKGSSSGKKSDTLKVKDGLKVKKTKSGSGGAEPKKMEPKKKKSGLKK